VAVGVRSVPGTLARRLLPGVGRVHAQVAPFAQAWLTANEDALRAERPLWVALGDSMSQGIGAQDISGGWVGQLHGRLAAAGRDLGLVNLSVTGARVRNVLDEQLPQLAGLPRRPVLVTVLVGANDMFAPRGRAAAVESFDRLIAALPADSTVIATLPRRNSHALAINALIDHAAAEGRVRVADMRGRTVLSLRGTFAEDHFHPNERGYSTIADRFGTALGLLAPPK
jgi:acyl-CoA thioesterase-1